MTIADLLLTWYRAHGRNLPWRQTTDPYAILVAEVMLQQTQVDRVIPKYEAWLEAFPNWKALSEAPRSDVLKFWSGLGYNNRAVRLHELSKVVVEELGGELPKTEDELVKLPGIGPYTAGAIVAFAYNKPGKCIDVNVERIMKRLFFSRRQEISKSAVERFFLASYPRNARAYANALMDFGSLICTASKPMCDSCPLYDECKSRGEREEEKEERAKKRQSRFLHSNRWWRGQILKGLNQGVKSEESLRSLIGHENRQAFQRALGELERDGLVVRRDNTLTF